MSTTTKIDFDPAMFGEGTPEAIEQPSIHLKPKSERSLFVFLVPIEEIDDYSDNCFRCKSE